jgi:hypothetical protein
MLHHIDFTLGDLTVWVKKKSQEENRFKSLFNIVSGLNTSTKVSEKEEEEMKKLDQELQKEEEEMSEYKKGHCCCCFEIFILYMHNNDTNFIGSSHYNFYFYGSDGFNTNGLWK